MEKGQSFGSADELQERRKKKGALPLAVFLSFNDRDVNPQCPNARNPYHKCGWHCLDKIPGGNMLLDLERSGGSSSEWEKMSEKKVLNPSCPNASNPYHKCADYCFAKITEKPQDAVKEPGKDKGVVITVDESAVNPNCKYASNPYHRCSKFCFENSPVGDLRKGVLKPNEQKLVRAADRVNPECKYASNPYHVCSEYCLQKAPERVQAGQAMNPKNLKERKKIVNTTERTGVNPNCRFASNPYHKCSEYCFQNVAQRDISDGVIKSEGKKAVNEAERRDRKPKCEKASNPYHKCTDNCFQEILLDNPAVEAPTKEKNSGQLKERKADHRTTTEPSSLDSDGMEATCINHNQTDSSKGITIHIGTNESESVFVKDEKEASMIELLDSQPLRIDAAELFKEWAKYCSLKATEDNEVKTEKTAQR
ncbi:uncharacterized protein LOC110108351 isoform X1 [Dendrobium catenatum]|uniref:Uncharacterized protein n=1 Tax=Dendrobium catenatum TaxID=906689 RepID=A0A2I0XD55_9ASPA|nr:uncharacterized protein LOC110108351 isoform X1 [Dendrobium catenatum]PKU85857.1 hypothetical protein MA16_Dca011788 [Dendrobium catenatum]